MASLKKKRKRRKIKRLSLMVLLVGLLLVGFSKVQSGTKEKPVTQAKAIAQHAPHQPTAQKVQQQLPEKPKKVKASFGKELTLKVNHNVTEWDTLRVKMSHFQVKPNFDDTHDAIVLDLSEKNIGKDEATELSFSKNSFEFFDQSGSKIEIEPLLSYEKQTFEDKPLSPNQTNEGTAYFLIPRGEKVAKVVLYSQFIEKEKKGNSYIFNVSQ